MAHLEGRLPGALALRRRLPEPKPIPRPAGRVILLDREGRVLLWRVEDPNVDASSLWITPGGALEPGESYEQAALRELAEETGLAGVPLGPCVWQRRHVWRWGGHWNDSLERFFLIRVDTLQISRAGLAPIEQEVMKEYRWWSVDDIQAATAEIFVPRRIAELLPPLIAGDLPTEPLDTGP